MKPEKKEEEIFITFTSTFALFVVNEDNTLHPLPLLNFYISQTIISSPPPIPSKDQQNRARLTRVSESRHRSRKLHLDRVPVSSRPHVLVAPDHSLRLPFALSLSKNVTLHYALPTALAKISVYFFYYCAQFFD